MKKEITEASVHGKTFHVSGKVAKTLKALVTAGNTGITSLTLAGTWAIRTGHYIFVLRKEYGLNIAMIKEAHGDGWHGRYVLLDPVQILKS